MYIIVPVKGGKEQTVNCCELKDLGDIAVQNETHDEDDESDVCKELGVPRYTPPVVQQNKREDIHTHRYPTRSKHKLTVDLVVIEEDIHPDLLGLDFSLGVLGNSTTNCIQLLEYYDPSLD